jgi:hypothetical protein
MSEQLVSIGRESIPGGCDVGCGSCAFRDTSQTRSEAWNVIRSQICVEGAVPFYCHIGMDWEAEDGQFTREQLRKMKVCEGWKAAVRERSTSRAWREKRGFKHSTAMLCLGALVAWQHETKGSSEKREINVVWQRLLRALFGMPDEARK